MRFEKNSPLLIDLEISIDIKIMATIDIAIKIDVASLKRPNAAPLFITNVICRKSLIIGMDSPTLSLM